MPEEAWQSRAGWTHTAMHRAFSMGCIADSGREKPSSPVAGELKGLPHLQKSQLFYLTVGKCTIIVSNVETWHKNYFDCVCLFLLAVALTRCKQIGLWEKGPVLTPLLLNICTVWHTIMTPESQNSLFKLIWNDMFKLVFYLKYLKEVGFKAITRDSGASSILS